MFLSVLILVDFSFCIGSVCLVVLVLDSWILVSVHIVALMLVVRIPLSVYQCICSSPNACSEDI